MSQQSVEQRAQKRGSSTRVRLASLAGQADRGRAASSALRPILIGAAALMLGIGGLYIIWLMRRPLALLVFGIVIAEALAPIVDWLDRWLPRVLAVLLVYLVLLLIFVGILYVIVPAMADQIKQLVTNLPELIQRVQGWISARSSGLPIGQNVGSVLTQQFGGLGSTLLSLPLAIFYSLFDMVVVLFISIYWLILSPNIWRFTLSLVPAERQARVNDVLEEMGRAMGGYIRGTAIDGLALGATAYAGLLLLGVHYPLVLGLLTALMEFVPVVGATVSAGLIVLVAYLQSPTLGLITFIFALAFHQLENHVLVPNVMHGQTDISPLFAVFAVFAGATVGGLVGAFIAIPLAAATQVWVKEVLAPAIRRRVGAGDPEPAE